MTLFRVIPLLLLSALHHQNILADDSLESPLPPEEAASQITVPEGFRATLFAGEPDLVQPIAFTFDDRGRLWVAECMTYPEWDPNAGPESHGNDRIFIFEDTDGDGHFDKRTVFADKLDNVSGLEIGFGGVFVCSAPNLLFIPIDGTQDKPAGPAQVLLNGWNVRDAHHNVFNGLTWGPDGWLYGLNGILSKSDVGIPGQPEDQRKKLDCGVWRYHPTKHLFEVVAHGTTNPWGLDFDDFGEAFITNCVIKHLWHIMPGAHYQRMFGEDVTPNVYGLLESCADHRHWAEGNWTDSRGGFGAHGDAGGGHAHAGCMIYLGDNWPDEYRNSVFMCNIHGKRINNDILEHKGSGYVAHHGNDLMFAKDPWFLGLSIKYGPDGGVFVSDWNNTGECHDVANIDRLHGRIFKITYGRPPLVKTDLSKMSDEELLKLLSNKNEWFVRHARRILQERAAAGHLPPGITDTLWKMASQSSEETRALRALWTLHATVGITDEQTHSLLRNSVPYVRAWAIRLALENQSPTASLLAELSELAKTDKSPVVCRFLASALQRIPIASRTDIITALISRADDAEDQNLPLMIWYGLEPSISEDPLRASNWITVCKLSLVRQFIARRLAELSPDGLSYVVEVLKTTEDPQIQIDTLRGIAEAYKENRRVDAPAGWQQVHEKLSQSNGEINEYVRLLSLLFGDPTALSVTRQIALDESAALETRERAIQSLVRYRDPELALVLRKVLADHHLASTVLRALAECPGDDIPEIVLSYYPTLDDTQRRDAVNTLVSRASWGISLLDAIDKGVLSRTDISAANIRQLSLLRDAALNDKISRVWGRVDTITENKGEAIAKFKAKYTPDIVKQADLNNGRTVFNRTCAQCHKLFDSGGTIGPNLTGSQRATLSYLFENIIAPSAIVAKEYLTTVVQTVDGRVVNGIIQKESSTALTLRTPTEQVIIPKSEIETRNTLNISLMPEGLLENLSQTDCRDLLGYLGSKTQVPAAVGGPSDESKNEKLH